MALYDLLNVAKLLVNGGVFPTVITNIQNAQTIRRPQIVYAEKR